MIPKRIVLENFLSFGTPATEIVFSDDEPLWVLGGPNGIGKSAVFDAMTYALFGQHRGGAENHADLIRHGTNGFRVTFEFEFNGVNYQIIRNRPQSGRPVQSIVQWADGGWTKTIQLPGARGKQDMITQWIEQTLGIGFAAFRASVLLRQGEADAIIMARGAERLSILKKIIGMDAYEDLSERVHGEYRWCKTNLENLLSQRNKLRPITDDEVKIAQEYLKQKEEDRLKAHESHGKAIERVPQASQWSKLEEESQSLTEQIREADSRTNEAALIRQNYKRLTDLTTVVPTLKQLVTLRDRLAATRKSLAEKQKEGKSLAEALRAKQLRKEIEQDKKHVGAVEAITKLKNDLAAFDPKLATLLQAARANAEAASHTRTDAVAAQAKARGLSEQAHARKQDFDKVEIGVKCSQCLQEVTAEHAEQERHRLAVEISRLDDDVRIAMANEKAAALALQQANAEKVRLEGEEQKRRDVERSLLEKQENLHDQEADVDPRAHALNPP